MSSKKKNLTKFKKFLIIYSGILAVFMIVFLIYVTTSLIAYESNQLESYIEKQMQDVKRSCEKGEVKDLLGEIPDIPKSKFESDGTSFEEGLKELINEGTITYELNDNSKDDDNPIYDIYLDNNLIFEMKLDGTEKENRLGLLTFSHWKTKSITSKMEKGIFRYIIEVPSNYKVYVNGLFLGIDEIVEEENVDELSQLALYQDIPHIVKYEVANLVKKPNIRIVDENDNDVQFEIKESVIKKELIIEKIEDKNSALEKIDNAPDIMKIAEDWSLFLSRDLKGTLHGYYDIKNYLIADSEMAKYAYKWATNIDIMFISNHTLDNPTFTGEKLENFEIYSDKAFSCEVYLEKNMTLADGQRMQDVMHEKMYFSYENDGWKLVNMQTLKGGDNRE